MFYPQYGLFQSNWRPVPALLQGFDQHVRYVVSIAGDIRGLIAVALPVEISEGQEAFIASFDESVVRRNKTLDSGASLADQGFSEGAASLSEPSRCERHNAYARSRPSADSSVAVRIRKSSLPVKASLLTVGAIRSVGVRWLRGPHQRRLRRSWRTACKAVCRRRSCLIRGGTQRQHWLMQAGVKPWEAAGYLGMSVDTLIKHYGHHSPDHQEHAACAVAPKQRRKVNVKRMISG